MALFPDRQAEIQALAQSMVAGLTANAADLQALLDSFVTLSDAQVAAQTAAVAACQIERRERPSGDRALVSMAIESEATPNNQERGKDWDYRLIAKNNADESVPSNTVAAVV
jgi:hypothetical protein